MSEGIAIRVLLIEDDEDVRLSTEQALSLNGFKVESFASVERARGMNARPRRTPILRFLRLCISKLRGAGGRGPAGHASQRLVKIECPRVGTSPRSVTRHARQPRDSDAEHRR